MAPVSHKPPVSTKGKGTKASSPKKHPGGRPSKYDPKFVEIGQYLCANYPMDHKGLAKAFQVSVDTITEWMKVHPEFSAAIKAGKDIWNTQVVEASLLKRATGFRFNETTKEQVRGNLIITKVVSKFVPPDPTSMIFYLKNRDPERWREKQTLEHTGKDGAELQAGALVLIPTKLSEDEWRKQVEDYLESQAGNPSPSKE